MSTRVVLSCLLSLLSASHVRAANVLLSQVEREIAQGIDARGQRATFDAYRKYLADRLDQTTGSRTLDDKTGNCRLTWVEQLLRHPLETLGESEAFTASLHRDAANGTEGMTRLFARAAQKLDVPRQRIKKPQPLPSANDALAVLKQSLDGATRHFRAALEPVAQDRRSQLGDDLYRVSTERVRFGSYFAGRERAREATDLAEKMDRAELYEAAQAIVPLLNSALLKQLAGPASSGSPQTLTGAEGSIEAIVETPQGKIVFGGTGKNKYRLDDMSDVACVVDRGGDDSYLEGTTSATRPVLIIVDISGNDTYQATKPGAQGGAVGGVSVLVDLAGNDSYRAENVAQGAAVAGIGILVDEEGNDSYFGLKRVQGSAVAGFAVLVDRAGKDEYRCALYGQGVGGPLGFGLLDDLAGADHYFAGGKFLDGYDDSPGYDAWSQGVGYGPRGTANGGIGVLLDGGGNDVYEYDYFSHGAGYWFAAGFARDFSGNDKYLGATRTMLDGSKRVEPRFLRYGTGFGCHYAVGTLIDDAGDDTYAGDMAGTGFSWDLSIGAVLDFGGNDHYTQTSAPAQGQAFQVGLAVLFDAAGNDEYLAPSQGGASPKPEYHQLPTGGGNFSFLIDYGGQDKYASGSPNNAVTERESKGGFLIDRAAPPAN